MAKSIYDILTLPQNATHEQVLFSYENTKKVLNEERYKDGDIGRIAARKLDELELAYLDYNSKREYSSSSSNNNAFGGYDNNRYDQVDSLCKDGRLDEAQELLDNMPQEAEWHYYQSLIFYKRDWFNESKRQLEIAINKNPNESKYRIALDKLNINMNNQANPNSYGNQRYTNSQYNNRNNNNDLATCCCYALCLDCLCHSC